MAEVNKGGVKSIICPEKRKIIMECVEIGMPYIYAGHAARISEKTLYNWLERGANDFDQGIDSEFSRFLQDIDQALSGRLKKHLNRINEGDKCWNSSAWMLERRWRKHFGQDAAVVEELTHRLAKLENLLDKKDEDPTS